MPSKICAVANPVRVRKRYGGQPATEANRNLDRYKILNYKIRAISTAYALEEVHYPQPLLLKKNQNAPRPSEHPPVRGEKCCFCADTINRLSIVVHPLEPLDAWVHGTKYSKY